MVDVAIIVVILIYVVVGWRRGFLLTLASALGALVGLAAGLYLAMPVASTVGPVIGADNTTRVVLALIVIVLLVVAVEAVGSVLGSLVLSSLRRVPTGSKSRAALGSLDRFAGSMLGGLLVLTLVWVAIGPLRESPWPRVSQAVSDSRVLAALDGVMPASARPGMRSLAEIIGPSRLPTLSMPLDAETVAEPAHLDTGLARDSAARWRDSVVRVWGQGRSCSVGQSGSGVVIGTGQVLTAAHVVAGLDEVEIEQRSGKVLSGQVVAFDPDADAAIVSVPDLHAPVRTVRGVAKPGEQLVMHGFPGGGAYQAQTVRVREQLTARGTDIYDRGSVIRRLYALEGDVRRGDSGGPLLSPRGDVVGLIVARSVDKPGIGYALTDADLSGVLATAKRQTGPVSTGPCRR
ncbi:MarP family serine protease [Devriesea agamarum]|uniref:MarP family serine protease n=1 Tax=Devriesea agamarum TaxID=472569 RepID=UPI00071C6ED2|nr:MarP family serine protease [Devriesea agamarum]